MSDLQRKLSDKDLLFMTETLIPEREDKEHLVALLRDDAEFIEAMLQADKLFERICTDREILVKISPRLFFAVLLRRARKDLQKEAYTIERSHRQRIPVFDSQRVADILHKREVPDYLADMLASFTRVESFSLPIRIRRGIWYRYRFSDMDIDGLIRYCQAIEEGQRFAFYKRIADVCLFLCSIFPEYIESQKRYPWRGVGRLRLLGQHPRTMEEYREEGKGFYERAAQHEAAQAAALDRILAKLAQSFLEAQKALAYMADRYLRFNKENLFAVE